MRVKKSYSVLAPILLPVPLLLLFSQELQMTGNPVDKLACAPIGDPPTFVVHKL